MEATNVLAGIEHGEHQALLAPASGHGRFVHCRDRERRRLTVRFSRLGHTAACIGAISIISRSTDRLAEDEPN
jgi:hypothetical protein